ncbi:MAG TPA: hypothetical protein VK914_02025 [bacterium]|jgi:hypothetical protein|nr:hypothetical protein [bacterium]
MSFSKSGDFIWRPFEIKSDKSSKQFESDLSNRILKGTTSAFVPYWTSAHYDKPYGTVSDGEFKIRFVPRSAVFSRGAGSFTLNGRIEVDGSGCKIVGHLPGPAFAIWVLAILSLGSYGMILIKFFTVLFDPNHGLDVLQPIGLLSAVFTAFTVGLFVVDRTTNRTGEEQIIGMLNDLAK